MQERNENQRTHGSSEPSAEHAIYCAEVASQFANKKADEETEKMADFRDLTEFVEHATEAANDPLYSKEALNSTRAAPKPKTPFEDQKNLPP